MVGHSWQILLKTIVSASSCMVNATIAFVPCTVAMASLANLDYQKIYPLYNYTLLSRSSANLYTLHLYPFQRYLRCWCSEDQQNWCCVLVIIEDLVLLLVFSSGGSAMYHLFHGKCIYIIYSHWFHECRWKCGKVCHNCRCEMLVVE